MSKRARVAAAVVITPVAAAGFLIAGIRSKYPPVVGLIRRFARDTGNPQVLKTAGTEGGPASVIKHAGRVSGRPLQTPVTPIETADGFVIALPYGSGTDWVKNVVAAGSATLVHQGQTYAVDQPEVVSLASTIENFGPRERRFVWLFGVQECLRLHRVDQGDDAG